MRPLLARTRCLHFYSWSKESHWGNLQIVKMNFLNMTELGGECLLSILSENFTPIPLAFSVSFSAIVKLFHFLPTPPKTPSSLALVYLFSAPLAEDSPVRILFLFSTLLFCQESSYFSKWEKIQVE